MIRLFSAIVALTLVIALSMPPAFDPSDKAPAVVMLLGPMGGGTGFGIISPITGKHYIMTNAHVCEVASAVQPQEGAQFALKILKVADFTDLCLAEAGYLQDFIQVATSSPSVFEHINVLGHGRLLPLTYTEGRYIGIIPDQVLSVYMPGYATATILPGNSGSPVMNDAGELVGVAYASADAIDNRLIMVPLADIYAFLAQYESLEQ
jgi:serine protease Do